MTHLLVDVLKIRLDRGRPGQRLAWLLLAAKSVARFKRMDEQRFAEIYLIGTMTSVLVAMVTGLVLHAGP